MASSDNQLLAQILAELQAMRQVLFTRPPVNQTATSSLESTGHQLPNQSAIRPTINPVQKSVASSQGQSTPRHGIRSTPVIPPVRKLKQIADRPIQIDICWYHRRHHIAANPRNCPGLSFCKFDLPAEIQKMKIAIDRAGRSSTPSQKRITATTSSTGIEAPRASNEMAPSTAVHSISTPIAIPQAFAPSTAMNYNSFADNEQLCKRNRT